MATCTVVITYTVGSEGVQEIVTGATVAGTECISGSPNPTAAEVNKAVKLLQTTRKLIMARNPTKLQATGTTFVP